MRALHPTDLDIATRVILWQPERAEAAREIVHRARMADAHAKRLRRPFGRWGTGTLAEAARSLGAPRPPGPCGSDYRAALRLILDAVDDHNS